MTLAVRFLFVLYTAKYSYAVTKGGDFLSIGLFIVSIFLYVILLIFFKDSMAAAQSGFLLWLNSVMPALFPFMVCTYVMQSSGVISYIAERLFSAKRLITRFLLLLFVFTLCSIAGAPSGARIFGSMFSKSSISKRYLSMLVASCNQFSPMFIAGTLCLSFLNAPELSIPIMIAHYGSAVPILILLAIQVKNQSISLTFDIVEKSSFFNVLSKGLSDSLSAILKVGAAIVFFMVLQTALTRLSVIDIMAKPLTMIGIDNTHAHALITGAIELTNGCALLSGQNTTEISAAYAAFMLSFGGVCIFMQSLLFCKVSPSTYFATKAIQGCIAYFICRLVTPLFFTAKSVFAQIDTDAAFLHSTGVFAMICASLISGCALFIVCHCMRRKRRLI